MAVKLARPSLVLCLVTTSVLAIATAWPWGGGGGGGSWGWGGGGGSPSGGYPWSGGGGGFRGPNGYCWQPCSDQNNTKKEIVVGGKDWHFGFNYSDWAIKNGPFYIGDTLVFKYDSPADPGSHNHSVYLLKDFQSYQKCSLSGANRLADPYAGSKDGFKLELTVGFPYFLACGEKNGLHCNQGLMKFIAWPVFR